MSFWKAKRTLRVECCTDMLGRTVKRVPDSVSPRLRQWLPVVPYFETPEEYKAYMEREDKEILVVLLPTPAADAADQYRSVAT